MMSVYDFISRKAKENTPEGAGYARAKAIVDMAELDVIKARTLKGDDEKGGLLERLKTELDRLEQEEIRFNPIPETEAGDHLERDTAIYALSQVIYSIERHRGANKVSQADIDAQLKKVSDLRGEVRAVDFESKHTIHEQLTKLDALDDEEAKLRRLYSQCRRSEMFGSR